jgi:hypothetical protein
MSHSSRRKHVAYLWLAFVGGALVVAHYFLFRFSFHPLNPFPVMRGLSFGLALWTAALMIAMCMRLGWARYVLIALLASAIVFFGLAAITMTTESVNALPEPIHAAVGGLGFYAVALFPLGASRALRRFLAPRQAGGG